ncbi:hypothetical protein Tco_0838227 [Tanacetum coccineum]|uniref:Uncharacterized protein n=1 Tax=Tanacetum coccineum TaxID=301880 RepID=A0ABQ5AM83_9ASTR
MGAVYGTPKSGVGVASMGVMRFELLMTSKSGDKVDLRVLIPETTFVGVESRILIPETTFVSVESKVLIPETTFVGVESRVFILETTVWDTLVYPSDTLVIRKQKLE